MRKGQTIIEAMIAMGVLSVGLLGILGLLNQSLALNRLVSDSYIATYLASEGIEVIRNMVDENVIGGQNYNRNLDGSWKLESDSHISDLRPADAQRIGYDPGLMLYVYGAPDTPYTRTVDVRTVGNYLEVRSQVNWVSRGGTAQSVQLEDRFYDWR